MAEVVRYPEPHCIRCWSDNCDHGVLDGGKVLGPYCRSCAKAKAAEIETYQRNVNKALALRAAHVERT